MPNRDEAKKTLDAVIRKSRVHLYKPIQIAEILYRDRVKNDIDLLNLEDYRTKSKKLIGMRKHCVESTQMLLEIS